MTEPVYYDLEAPVTEQVNDDEIAAMMQRNTFLQARSGREYTTIPRLVAYIRTLQAENAGLRRDLDDLKHDVWKLQDIVLK